MADQAGEERTIVISGVELLDHTILTRKKHELLFKKDFLLRTGAKEGDLHLKAIDEELAHVSGKLSPIEEKLAVADMITLLPNRREIDAHNLKIGGYSRIELDDAVRKKNGEAYDLMKKRAVLVRNNFERREDVVRLTMMLNNMPRQEGEALQQLIEDGAGEDADVSFLPKEKQQELVDLASHLGKECCVFAGKFSMDKKKAESSELKPAQMTLKALSNSRQVWIESKKMADFDENEKRIAVLLAKIQAIGAEKQARELSEKEAADFDKLQEEYIAAKQKRNEFFGGVAEKNETINVSRKKKEEAKELDLPGF